TIPDLVEVPLQILLERRQCLAVDACRTTVGLHPSVRFPHKSLRNLVRLCLRHRLLPLLVDLCPWLDRRAPLLRRHYPASSLLRARPPLRLASVLGSSWVHHLEVSLSIEAGGSHVPHRSLRWAHAVSMPVAARAVSRQSPELWSRANDRSPVSATFLNFRHLFNGSLAFVFPAPT